MKRKCVTGAALLVIFGILTPVFVSTLEAGASRSPRSATAPFSSLLQPSDLPSGWAVTLPPAIGDTKDFLTFKRVSSCENWSEGLPSIGSGVYASFTDTSDRRGIDETVLTFRSTEMAKLFISIFSDGRAATCDAHIWATSLAPHGSHTTISDATGRRSRFPKYDDGSTALTLNLSLTNDGRSDRFVVEEVVLRKGNRVAFLTIRGPSGMPRLAQRVANDASQRFT